MPERPRTARPARRLLQALALVLGVVAVHLLVLDRALESRLGDGAADRPPQAIDVAFVKSLAPSLPPVAAPARPARRVRPPRPPQPAASAASAPAVADTVAKGAEGPMPADASASAVTAEAAVAAASAPPPVPAATPASAAALAFDWPPSTRLGYTLAGYYRGPLNGTARVDWLRQDRHYQVRVEVAVFGLFKRQMLSDGELGDDGLRPRRFDQITDVVMREVRQETVQFDGEQILLPNGKSVPHMPGVQDTASQFVQLTWLFLTHPERLRAGEVVEFPLALPRRAGRWRYEVQPPEPLALPFGAVQAYRLKPMADSFRPNEIQVELWVAPSLQYLPVKIGLRVDAETYLDLSLDGPPLQAAR